MNEISSGLTVMVLNTLACIYSDTETTKYCVTEAGCVDVDC